MLEAVWTSNFTRRTAGIRPDAPLEFHLTRRRRPRWTLCPRLRGRWAGAGRGRGGRGRGGRGGAAAVPTAVAAEGGEGRGEERGAGGHGWGGLARLAAARAPSAAAPLSIHPGLYHYISIHPTSVAQYILLNLNTSNTSFTGPAIQPTVHPAIFQYIT